MRATPLYIISLLTAFLPMLTGTIIFWTWFCYPKLDDLELWGIRTIMISVPICIAGIFLAFVVSRKNKANTKAKRNTTKAILLILGNIPMAAFYIWFASYLMDTERITIINNSDADVEDIHIFGVGDYDKIDKIKKGKSKTVWVHMTHEGSIRMKYTKIEQVDTVLLNGYTGPLMGGQKSKYNIKLTEEDRKN